MRKTRPEDFDPNYRSRAEGPRPEAVDLADIVPIKPKPSYHGAGERRSERSEGRTEERTQNRSEFRSIDLPVKRRTKRYSFEFYEDQITRLKQLKIGTEMAGENISLSEMVRQAMDKYLQNK